MESNELLIFKLNSPKTILCTDSETGELVERQKIIFALYSVEARAILECLKAVSKETFVRKILDESTREVALKTMVSHTLKTTGSPHSHHDGEGGSFDYVDPDRLAQDIQSFILVMLRDRSSFNLLHHTHISNRLQPTASSPTLMEPMLTSSNIQSHDPSEPDPENVMNGLPAIQEELLWPDEPILDDGSISSTSSPMNTTTNETPFNTGTCTPSEQSVDEKVLEDIVGQLRNIVWSMTTSSQTPPPPKPIRPQSQPMIPRLNIPSRSSLNEDTLRTNARDEVNNYNVRLRGDRGKKTQRHSDPPKFFENVGRATTQPRRRLSLNPFRFRTETKEEDQD